VGVYFRGFWIFDVLWEKISRIWISDFTCGNNSLQIFMYSKVTKSKVTKDGSHLVVFVTLLATNFTEVQQCKKATCRSKFLRDFCWREFVFTGFITDQLKIRKIRDN